MPIEKYIVKFERFADGRIFTRLNNILAFPDPAWPDRYPWPGQIWQVTISRKNENGSYLLMPIKSPKALINGKGASKKVEVIPHWKKRKKK